MVELESEDLELASRSSELLENFDPLTAALIEISRGGQLLVYLQSNASKVDLIPLSDASEPRVCIGGALRSFVSRVHNILAMIPGLSKLSTRLETPRTD